MRFGLEVGLRVGLYINKLLKILISRFLRILKGVFEDFPSKLFRFDGLKSLSIFLILIQIESAILVLFSLFQLKRLPNFSPLIFNKSIT